MTEGACAHDARRPQVPYWSAIPRPGACFEGKSIAIAEFEGSITVLVTLLSDDDDIGAACARDLVGVKSPRTRPG